MQTMIAQVTTGANTNWVSGIVEVPLLNLGVSGMPNVLEICKVEMLQTQTAAVDLVLALGSYDLGGTPLTNIPYSVSSLDKRFVTWQRSGAFGAVAFDLTDENGKGLLYPGQQLFASVSSVPGTAATVAIKIYYRIRKSNLQEYLGIINQYIVTQL